MRWEKYPSPRSSFLLWKKMTQSGKDSSVCCSLGFCYLDTVVRYIMSFVSLGFRPDFIALLSFGFLLLRENLPLSVYLGLKLFVDHLLIECGLWNFSTLKNVLFLSLAVYKACCYAATKTLLHLLGLASLPEVILSKPIGHVDHMALHSLIGCTT